jgi:hypothetical protein
MLHPDYASPGLCFTRTMLHPDYASPGLCFTRTRASRVQGSKRKHDPRTPASPSRNAVLCMCSCKLSYLCGLKLLKFFHAHIIICCWLLLCLQQPACTQRIRNKRSKRTCEESVFPVDQLLQCPSKIACVYRAFNSIHACVFTPQGLDSKRTHVLHGFYVGCIQERDHVIHAHHFMNPQPCFESTSAHTDWSNT